MTRTALIVIPKAALAVGSGRELTTTARGAAQARPALRALMKGWLP